MWIVRISDSYCTWQYSIKGRDNTSINKTAQNMAGFLEGNIEESHQIVEKTTTPYLQTRNEDLAKQVEVLDHNLQVARKANQDYCDKIMVLQTQIEDYEETLLNIQVLTN